MAEQIKINDVAKQLGVASRLVTGADSFWVYVADGTQVRIPAAWVRAYLADGIKPTVKDGQWVVGGESTGVAAEGITPMFRAGRIGIDISTDKGATWETLVTYRDIYPNLEPLEQAYTNITAGEEQRVSNEESRKKQEQTRQGNETARVNSESARATAESTRQTNESTRQTKEGERQKAETTRSSNESSRQTNETARGNAETARVEAEKKRVTAETARVSAEKTRSDNETTRQTNEGKRQDAEAARQKSFTTAIGNAEAATQSAKEEAAKATSATASSKAQTDIATVLNANPPKVGENGNWWTYDITKQQYADTGVLSRGGVIYPSFVHKGNKLYLVDYGLNANERIVKKGNKLTLKL